MSTYSGASSSRKVKTRIGKDKRDTLTTKQRRAVKRLMKELKQIKKEPIAGVSALPASDKNLFLWHANIKGPEGTVWEKGIFHLEMTFPGDYPDNPPSLRLCTKIVHPNVFGNEVCLDMLQKQTYNGGHYGKEVNQGWSSSYTVQSILIQLQAFLFEAEVSKVLSKTVCDPKQYEKKKREWHSAVEFSVQQSLIYHDKVVNHFPPRNPWPPLPTEEEIKASQQTSMTEEERIRSELVCFYTRQSFEEDCLGLGLRFTKNLRTGTLSSIHAELDLISLRAYMNHKLRFSSENEAFTHWLPLFINEKHSEKALYLCDHALSIIMTGKHTAFDPMQAYEVFPKLMNSFIVTLMSGKKHHSIRALRAYCNVHRLFLSYCSRFPEVAAKCQETVDAFINSGAARHKDNLPNLGEFLAMLSVTNRRWSDLKASVLDEFFTRGVFWILNKYPELEAPEHPEVTDDDRLEYSFEVHAVSARNLLFHVFFLSKIAFIDNLNANERALAYDKLYGRCSPAREDLFIAACEAFLKVDSYEAFYACLNEETTKEAILKELRDAVIKSRAKGYHGTTAAVLSPEEFAKQNQAFDFNEMCVERDGVLTVIDDEPKWKAAAHARWGFTEIPEYLEGLDNPWRKLYLQYNLQDLISKFNDSPAFKRFHKTLDVSQEIPRLEIMMFNPSNIKSRYYYLTCLLTKLVHLDTLVIRKGTEGLGVRGFKALIKGLTNNPGNLTRLILEHCGIDGDSIRELTKGTKIGSNLKALMLKGNPLGDAGAKNLAAFLRHHQNLPNLEELDLSNCNINARGAAELAEALLVKSKLKKFNILRNNFGTGLQGTFTNLAYNPSLEELNASRISGSCFSDGGQTSFSKLLKLTVSLKRLNMWKTSLHQFDSSVFDQLANNTTLKDVDFGETSFNTKMGQLGTSLGKNSTLTQLNLAKNGINVTNLQQFLNNLKESWKHKHKNEDYELALEHLELQENPLNTTAEKLLPLLGNFVSMCKNLTYLNLNHCSINPYVARHLGASLLPEVGLKLETLLLRGNALGKLGIKYMREGLSNNVSLKTLDLSGNDVGVIGAQYIAEVIDKNSSLEDLNLFGNFLEIEGVTHIAKALTRNTTLKKIDLGMNRAKVRGATALLDVFAQNNVLEHVALKHNNINDTVALKIADAIIKNSSSSISYIAFAGNPLTTDIRREIAVAFKKRGNLDFDLAKLVEVKDPERLERTVYMTPLSADISEIKLKKLFYDHKCGVILSVNIHSHKKRMRFDQAKYAFVEFAHPDSVTLARNLAHKKLNKIDGATVRIARAGI